MRQYEPIWNRIKTHNSASIVTTKRNASRVVRAVSKEKDKDIGYKLLLSDKALIAKLHIRREPSKIDSSILIRFSLQTSIKETYIGVSNL